MRSARLETPIGPLHLLGRDDVVTRILLPGADVPAGSEEDARAFTVARRQLAAYFEGHRTDLSFEVAPEGTAFQQAVWTALRQIPFGATSTYADIARAIGKPGGTQAVGQANGANPCPIVIPCHRVIAADGTLGGFSGGLEAKRQLLALEGAWAEQPRLL